MRNVLGREGDPPSHLQEERAYRQANKGLASRTGREPDAATHGIDATSV